MDSLEPPQKKYRSSTKSVAYEGAKYYATLDTLPQVLQEYGVAILPSVLNDTECDDMIQGMWSSLSHLTQQWEQPIQKDNESSWLGFNALYPMHSMLLQHHGIGHAPFVWNVRQNEKCIAGFCALYQSRAEDMLVSFDGVSFHFPPEKRQNRGWYNKNWFHCDERFDPSPQPAKKLFPTSDCVQSWVTAFDIDDGDATLSILEKSHLYHHEFGQTFGLRDKKDWYAIQSETQAEFFAQRGCQEVRIRCPRGSQVFWMSSLMHCGVEPLKDRVHPHFRLVTYLCYQPRSAVPQHTLIKALNKRRQAFDKKRMTSHWPLKATLFPAHPQTYGKPLPVLCPLPEPDILPLGRKLIGF